MRTTVLLVCLGAAVALAACDTVAPTYRGNRAPVIAGLPDTSVAVGDTLFLDFDISDPDGDDFEITVIIDRSRDEIEGGYWPRMGIFWDDTVFWYAPVVRDGTSRAFGFEVDDHRGGVTTHRFTIRVLPPSAILGAVRS